MAKHVCDCTDGIKNVISRCSEYTIYGTRKNKSVKPSFREANWLSFDQPLRGGLCFHEIDESKCHKVNTVQCYSDDCLKSENLEERLCRGHIKLR